MRAQGQQGTRIRNGASGRLWGALAEQTASGAGGVAGSNPVIPAIPWMRYTRGRPHSVIFRWGLPVSVLRSHPVHIFHSTYFRDIGFVVSTTITSRLPLKGDAYVYLFTTSNLVILFPRRFAVMTRVEEIAIIMIPSADSSPHSPSSAKWRI